MAAPQQRRRALWEIKYRAQNKDLKDDPQAGVVFRFRCLGFSPVQSLNYMCQMVRKVQEAKKEEDVRGTIDDPYSMIWKHTHGNYTFHPIDSRLGNPVYSSLLEMLETEYATPVRSVALVVEA